MHRKLTDQYGNFFSLHTITVESKKRSVLVYYTLVTDMEISELDGCKALK